MTMVIGDEKSVACLPLLLVHSQLDKVGILVTKIIFLGDALSVNSVVPPMDVSLSQKTGSHPNGALGTTTL